MSVLLAAMSAALWGCADYCGGAASRKADALQVVALSQLVGLPLIAATASVVGGAPTVVDAGWGALAGLAGLAGLVLLYRGLSTGLMAVVAPTTAVSAALVPLLVGLALEPWPGTLPMLGVGSAVTAVGLVSMVPGVGQARATASVLGLALGAGVTFGLFFIALDQVDPAAGVWPLVFARLAAVGFGVAVAARLKGRRVWVRQPWRWIVGAGVLDVVANACYLFAGQHGPLSIVAPVAALYPASTVLLALTIDRERLRPLQMLGLAFAATALVLVSGSG